MLKSFASLSLAVSTASAVQFSNNLEDEIAGYHHWPDTRCCRMYTEPNFLGWYRDFCAPEHTPPGVNPTLQLWDDPTDAYYFDRQMSSWKCGAGVAVKFCFGDAINRTRSNDITWEDEIHTTWQSGTECRYSESESGRALGYNKDISASNSAHDNKVRTVVLMPYDPLEFPMI